MLITWQGSCRRPKQGNTIKSKHLLPFAIMKREGKEKRMRIIIIIIITIIIIINKVCE